MKKWKIIISFLTILCTITLLKAQTYHIVKQGENLSYLAGKYHCSIQQIKSWNNLRNNDIYIGQRLIVGNYSNKYYTIQWGDTLSSIASRYGVSIGWLEKVNGINNPYDLEIGQKLIVGQSYNTPVETNYSNYSNKYYTIQWGDTLSSIASRYGVSIGWLERVNGIQNPYDLRMGQRLIVGQYINQSYNTPVETNYSNYSNKYYIVQWGNTLDSIAARYGVSIGWLERVNGIHNPYDLRMGQRLIVGQSINQTRTSTQQIAYATTEKQTSIQTKTNIVEPKNVSSVINNASSVIYYQVKIGDTLASIAKKFQINPNWLAKENLITNNLVTPGEIIVIPEVANKTTNSNSETSQTDNNFFASIGHKIIQYADTFLGTPYVYGGTSRDGIDCSGLTQRVYKEIGINLPRTAAEQYRYGHPIHLAEAQPGDLIFFHFGGYYIDHVGIYIGNNRFIQAGTDEGRVVITRLNSYLRAHIAGVRTYFAENGNGG
ncbi:MAG: LysM peptidoglycan-binding domain-containing protein [Candidatus Omnitrophica bacterium]|jgi:cell wall-associated NlpC family hydrolase|nr:LysM peptidoglycan-binding domain-containing protein [Candidatus Omnitrophota bacterium]